MIPAAEATLVFPAACGIRWRFFGRSVMKLCMKSERIQIPSAVECERLIAETGMLENIIAHSRQVCRVSLWIADHRKTNGLDRDLIRAAALLHDITKTRSFSTGEDHAETGKQMLTEMGYPEVGCIVGQHVRLDRYFGSSLPDEAEIVNYADKRVLHDRIVPLSERMEYIVERYGLSAERRQMLMSLWEKSEALEHRLFAGLSVVPEDMLLD